MRKRIFIGILLLLFCIPFCGCGDAVFLPDAGYDYTVADDSGILLGYPMTRAGENDYLLSGDTETPCAFLYDAQEMEYSRVACKKTNLICGKLLLPVCYAGKHGKCVYFSYEGTDAESGKTYRVYEGCVGGYAVIAVEKEGVWLCAEKSDRNLSMPGKEAAVLDVSCTGYVLYTETLDGMTELYLYKNGTRTLLYTSPVLEDGWIATVWEDDMPGAAVVFRADGQWMVAGETGDAVCACPAETGEETVYIRRTVFAMVGNSTSFRLSDVRSGAVWEMDMGGLYRLNAETETASIPISADGMFVYYYDNDFIYRLNLTDGTLDLGYNEAPLINNICVLTSMTPVTDEIILLSQAPDEATEYVPYISCTVFEEELPAVKEDEKIDLDTTGETEQ